MCLKSCPDGPAVIGKKAIQIYCLNLILSLASLLILAAMAKLHSLRRMCLLPTINDYIMKPQNTSQSLPTYAFWSQQYWPEENGLCLCSTHSIIPKEQKIALGVEGKKGTEGAEKNNAHYFSGLD